MTTALWISLAIATLPGLLLGVALLRKRFHAIPIFFSMLAAFFVSGFIAGFMPGMLASAAGMLFLLCVVVLYLGIAFCSELLSDV
jgi:hypothetical protein